MRRRGEVGGGGRSSEVETGTIGGVRDGGE